MMIFQKIKEIFCQTWASVAPQKHRICCIGMAVSLMLAVISCGIGWLVALRNVANLNIMLFCFPFLLLYCLFFCLDRFADRFLLMTFVGVVFVFLMGRPILNLKMGKMWYRHLDPDGMVFALTAVSLSLLCLCLGTWLMERYLKKKQSVCQPITAVPKKQGKEDFQLAALLIYGGTMAFFLLGELDKLLFMRGREYEEFFLSYSSSLPSIVSTFAAMMPLALCAYLATMPEKRMAFCALALYVISAAPQFLIGIRNPIVLNVLLALLYYYYRDRYGDRQKWYGKLEKGAILLAAPGGAAALALIDFLRSGDKVAVSGLFSAITDLFYKQGVSFNVLCKGYAVLDRLPGPDRNFTFGPFIDYFQQGRLGQALLGTMPLPDGNSVLRAWYGHNLSHSLSFLINKKYLEGAGSGSSYILELYCDYGWAGIVIGSLLLGALLAWFVYGFRKNWLVRTLILVCLTDIFFIPRAEATGWLLFLVQPHIWIVVLGCVVGGKLLAALRIRERIGHLLRKRKK